MSTWFYVDNARNRQGPVDAEAVAAAFAAGQLNDDSLVWREGLAEWVPLEAHLSELPLPAPAAPAGIASLRTAGESLAELERRIVRQTAKAGDGIISRHINRPISQSISRRLLRLAWIRPVHATWGTALLAVAMLAALLLGTRGGGVAIDPAHVPGYLAALGAAVTWSLYSVLNRRFEAVPSAAMAGSCLAVGVLGGIAHLALETTVLPTAGQGALILLLGLGPTGIAFWLWDIGTKRGDIAVLGTLSYAAPLLSTGLLLAFGQAKPHWTQAVAVALLLLGAWLSVRTKH